MLKNISTKKLYIFDLDGTLTESKSKISPKMGSLISKLLENKKVAVISGGKFDQFKKQFLSGLKTNAELSNLSLFPTNSTTSYQRKNSSWKKNYEEKLSSKEKEGILSAIKKLQTSKIYKKPTKTYGSIIENRGTQITISAIGQLAPVSEKKKWNETSDKRSAYIALLRKDLKKFEIKKGGLTSIDITRKGIDKSYGIKKILKALNVHKKDAVFIGDAFYRGGNDAPARKAGIDCIPVSGPKDTEKIIKEALVAGY
jgi:HAD superfamily hydrolase (TIGR01484 family)